MTRQVQHARLGAEEDVWPQARQQPAHPPSEVGADPVERGMGRRCRDADHRLWTAAEFASGGAGGDGGEESDGGRGERCRYQSSEEDDSEGETMRDQVPNHWRRPPQCLPPLCPLAPRASCSHSKKAVLKMPYSIETTS